MDVQALLSHDDFMRSLAKSLVFGSEEYEDVVQDAYLAALRHPPRPGPGLRGWCATVIRNAVRQRRRSNLRLAAREAKAARPETVPGAAEIREREAVRQEVVDRVLALDPLYRDVLLLRHFEGIPPREIASRLKLPVETVKTRLKRGIERLRMEMDERHHGDRRAWAMLLLPFASPARAADARERSAAKTTGARLTRTAPFFVAGILAVLLLSVGIAVVISLGGKDGEAGPTPEEQVASAPAAGVEDAGSLLADSTPVVADRDHPGAGGRTEGAPLPGGRVVDLEGNPVEGAQVVVSKDRQETTRPFATTDAAGRFPLDQVEPGQFVLAFVMAKASSAWVRFEEGADRLVLEVGPGGIVEGRVVDPESGGLVGGARVLLRIGRGFVALTWWTESAADGTYRFEGVPLGLLAIPAVADGLRHSSAGPDLRMVREEEEAEIVRRGGGVTFEGPGQRFTKDVGGTPRPGVEVTYRIRPAPGRELPATLSGTQVWVSRGNHWTVGFEDALDREDPKIVRFLPVGTNSLSLESEAFWAALPAREVRDRESPDEVEVALRPKSRAIVQLVGEDGEPLRREGVEVVLWRRSGGSGSGTTYRTDLNGRADVSNHLPPPSMEADPDLSVITAINVRGDGFFDGDDEYPNLRITGPELLARMEEAGADPLVLKVPAWSFMPLEIRVVDRDGRPVAGARIIGRDAKYFKGPAEGITDTAGRLTLKIRAADPAGRFELFADLPWWGESEICRLLYAGSGGEVAFVVERARTLQVRFLDEHGVPIADTPVRLDRFEGRTNASGYCAFHPPRILRGGSMAAEGYLTSFVKFESGDRALDVSLTRGRSLRVTVPQPEGVTAAELRWWAEEDPFHTKGTLRLRDGVYSGTFEVPFAAFVLAVSTTDGLYAGRVACPDGVPSVRPSLASRELVPAMSRFVDEGGEPVAEAGITLKTCIGGTIWLEHRGTTDVDGRLTVDLPPTRDGRVSIESATWATVERSPAYEAPSPGANRIVLSPSVEIRVKLDFSRTEGQVDWSSIGLCLVLSDGSETDLALGPAQFIDRVVTLRTRVSARNGVLRVTVEDQVFELPFDGPQTKVPVFRCR